MTAEDRRRWSLTRRRRQVEQRRQTAANLGDFYADLQMKVYFERLNQGNMARAVQLSQKTNQFNTTTRRYEQRDLLQIVDEGGDVIVIVPADRYTPLENGRPSGFEARR